MRESSIERRLGTLVRKAGGLSIKILPVMAGVPDRLILLPEGRFFLVELKAPKGRLRPIQKVRHDQIRALGIEVYVLASTAEVEVWAAENITHQGTIDPGTIERKP